VREGERASGCEEAGVREGERASGCEEAGVREEDTMKHRHSMRKLGRTSSHRWALLRFVCVCVCVCVSLSLSLSLLRLISLSSVLYVFFSFHCIKALP
jgi:hypothetical protein